MDVMDAHFVFLLDMSRYDDAADARMKEAIAILAQLSTGWVDVEFTNRRDRLVNEDGDEING